MNLVGEGRSKLTMSNPESPAVDSVKVGDWLYIDSEAYLSHGEDDVHGGLAQIKEIRDDGYVVFVGFEDSWYNLKALLKSQTALKQRYGDEKAFKDPDTRQEFN